MNYGRPTRLHPQWDRPVQQYHVAPDGRRHYGPPTAHRWVHVPASASTGFTAPSVTYIKMRQMEDGTAGPLGRDITANLPETSPFRQGWNAWYQKAWLPFYEKYAGPNASEFARLGAAISSDDLARRAESFRKQLDDFFVTYPQQKRSDGSSVPASSGVRPYLGELPGGDKGGLGLPWWMYGIGIALLGGVGYLGYVKAKELTAKRKALEEHVLPKLIGKDLAKAASAR